MESKSYIPGVCNIGATGIARRRQAGIAAAVISALFYVSLLVGHAPAACRLLLFLPVTGAAISFFQARFHFCVAYGFSGMYKVLKSESGSVDSEEFRRVDRRKAISIIGYGVLVGLVVTVIAYCV